MCQQVRSSVAQRRFRSILPAMALFLKMPWLTSGYDGEQQDEGGDYFNLVSAPVRMRGICRY